MNNNLTACGRKSCGQRRLLRIVDHSTMSSSTSSDNEVGDCSYKVEVRENVERFNRSAVNII